jgi:RsiW-degrading membrane proteinase PrsW (M82 family)
VKESQMTRHPANDEIRLAEFAQLRAEIGQRTAIQQALIALNLTVCGTVTGFVAADKAPDSLLLSIVYISSTFAILWLDHHRAIHQVATYIEFELWDWRPSWETYLRGKQPPWWRLVFLLAIGLVFVGIAAAAAFSVKDALEGAGAGLQVVWWVGVAITLLVFLGFAAALRLGSDGLKDAKTPS